jgi:aminoglycoside phosphotransferase (APT) family kinase protein
MPADLEAFEDRVTIERGLAERFPQLAIAPLRRLETGFGSLAVETPDGVVFRIARHPDAAAGHEVELRLLPALGSRVPIALPRPEWRIEPGAEDFPFGAIGYRRLAGEPLRSAGSKPVAPELGAFLAALHAFPVAEAEALGVPFADRHPDDLEALRGTILPALSERLTPMERARIDEWWDAALADEDLTRFEPCLRHGDLWYGNVLVSDGRVVGVVDWENAAIGDPAHDLATQRHLGSAFANSVLVAYRAAGGLVDARSEHRIQRRWEARELDGIAIAAALDDDAELDECIRKLRAGPILRQ